MAPDDPTRSLTVAHAHDGRTFTVGEMYTCRQIDAPWEWERAGSAVTLVAIISASIGVFSDGKEEHFILDFENVA